MNRLQVISGCGGTGRTTVAANIAHALAARGERVCLRDDDPQQALAVHFRSLEQPGDIRSRAMASPAYRPLTPNVDLALEHSSGMDQFANIDRKSPGEHGMVIIDTPLAWNHKPLTPTGDDYVLCVITPEARCFRTLPPLMRRHVDAADQGLRRNFLGLVNAFEPESALARDTVKLVEDAFGARLLPDHIMRDTSIPEAFAGGLPIAEYAPWSQAADAFGKVADILIAMQAARHAAA